MSLKPYFLESIPFRGGVLACLMLTGVFSEFQAQQDTTRVKEVLIQSKGLPVAYATILNTRTGQAAVANSLGVAVVPM